MPKLEPPKKKEEKIIGFEDFERNDGQDDFSAFPTSFGDDWSNSPSKSQKKEEEAPKENAFQSFGFTDQPDQGKNGQETNAFEDFSDFTGGFGDFSFKNEKTQETKQEEEKQEEEFDLLGGGDETAEVEQKKV